MMNCCECVESVWTWSTTVWHRLVVSPVCSVSRYCGWQNDWFSNV